MNETKGMLQGGALYLLVLGAIFVVVKLTRPSPEQPQLPSALVIAEDGPRHSPAVEVGDTHQDALGVSTRALSEGPASVPSDVVSVPLPFQDQLDHLAMELDPVYLPSKKAFDYHVEHHFGQIEDLELSYVRGLFEDWGEWVSYFIEEGAEGTVRGRFGMPTPDDVDRLWNSSGFQVRFARYLEIEHESQSEYHLSQAYQNDDLRTLSDQTGLLAQQAWDDLWDTPDAFMHWAFLMEVAQRHFK